MGVAEYMPGFVRVEITGGEPQECLNLCAKNGVPVRDCECVDAYTLRFKIPARQEKKLPALAERSGAELKVLRRKGVGLFFKKMRRRVALLIGLLLLLAGLFVSSLHIWEIEVSGNVAVSTSEILYALEDCGVGIGSFWPGIDQDLLRGEVMAKLPELSFITVNVYGSRAEVIVRERTPAPAIIDDNAAANVVAGKAGMITEVRAYRGVAAVSPGQTVLPGECLISGTAPSFRGFRAEHAQGDVIARTWVERTAAAPLIELQKQPTGRETTRTALIFGKTRINFYGGAGIPYADCDKIIDTTPLAIRGAFSLPISFVRERYAEYTLSPVRLDEKQVGDGLERQLLDELRAGLPTGGEIVTYSFTRLTKGDNLYVTIRAECFENIAVERPFTQEDYAAIERQNAVPNSPTPTP